MAEPIVVEETYSVKQSAVWSAITDPVQMAKWYFGAITSFEPEVGFETQFSVHIEGADYVHLWEVTEVEPGNKVAYRFNFEGYDTDLLVSWELSEVAGGTQLTFIQTGLDTLPRGNPLFSRDAGMAGWTYFLKDSLKRHLERR